MTHQVRFSLMVIRTCRLPIRRGGSRFGRCARSRQKLVDSGKSKCQSHARRYRYRIRFYAAFLDDSILFRARCLAGARRGERISTMRRLGGTVWGVIVFLTLALARDAAAQWIPLNPVSSVQKQD